MHEFYSFVPMCNLFSSAGGRFIIPAAVESTLMHIVTDMHG